jgi:hypothetical protein
LFIVQCFVLAFEQLNYNWYNIINYWYLLTYFYYGFFLQVIFMVFNATFNNISVISWQSVLLVEETCYDRTRKRWYIMR